MPKEPLIKSVRGELVEPRTDDSLAIYGVSRSPFDKLRANGRLNQRFPKEALNKWRNKSYSLSLQGEGGGEGE